MSGDHEALLPIDSGDVSHMRATSSAEWLPELNRCMARHALWPLVLALGAIVVGLVLYVHSPGVVFYATLAALCALTLYVAHRDGVAGTAVLHYRLAGGAAARSERVQGAFREIMGCDAVWHIAARGKVGEQKYFANADRLCLRTRVRPRIAAPPAVATNVSTPCLPAGRRTDALFPARPRAGHRRPCRRSGLL